MNWLRLDELSPTSSPPQQRKVPAGRSAVGLGSLTLGLGTLDAFAFNGADLTPDHRRRVAEVAGLLVGLLVKDPGGRIAVTGHTDLVGGEEVNLDLGRKRAVAVAAALHEAGVPLAALDVTSAGESAPLVATQGREPRNRRVEIRFAGAPIGTGDAGGLRLGAQPPPVTVPRPETFVPGDGPGTVPSFGTAQKTPGTATPPPGQTPSRVDPGRAEPQTKSGSAGDVAKAVAALPAVKKLLDDAQARVARDADKLTTGDKVVLGTVGGSMAAAAIAGLASDPAARKGVLDLIDGQEIPVPGLRGVSIVPHTKGGGVGGGVGFDIVKIFGGGGKVSSPDRLFALLPAVYREQDAEQGDVLAALLRIVTEQVDVVEADVAQLYDDLFIETCRSWVVPYIGDLVGNDPLRDAVRSRADVAKTISYRRRKGTLPMLEELARDVTGWAAHAVEFLELVGWSQHLEHIRPQAANFDVRSLERDDRVGGAFDAATHSVDVRAVGRHEGWHHHRHIGFFLWRLGGYPLRRVPARRGSPGWRFHFSPLGNAAPLFSRERREGDEAGLASELHVPGPIRRAFFQQDLATHKALTPIPASTDLYGTPGNPEASIDVTRNGTHVPPDQVTCARLDPWPSTRPTGNVIAVDVAVGRLAVGDGFTGASQVDVDFVYGFPADLGGGPYERRTRLLAPAPGRRFYTVLDGAAAPDFPDVTSALARWVTDGRPEAVVRILDSRTYTLPASVTLPDTHDLAIEADDGQRPVLTAEAGEFAVDADGTDPDPEHRGRLTLSGVVVEGFVHVTGDLGGLRLVHTTLIPGRTIAEGGTPGGESLRVEGGGTLNTHLELELTSAIAGALVIPPEARSITIADSIVDAGSPTAGAITAGSATAATTKLDIFRSTVVGRTNVRELEVSEAIFTGRVDTAQTQAGCVRFSFVPVGSRTPRRHRCQPDLAIRAGLDPARMQPSFTAGDYGQPAYLQLRTSTPVEIRTGAADGAEMGAYCQLKQPQRESNLRTRLDEYLPFGLEAGPIYIT